MPFGTILDSLIINNSVHAIIILNYSFVMFLIFSSIASLAISTIGRITLSGFTSFFVSLYFPSAPFTTLYFFIIYLPTCVVAILDVLSGEGAAAKGPKGSPASPPVGGGVCGWGPTVCCA